jgi:general secretion pathway protein L
MSCLIVQAPLPHLNSHSLALPNEELAGDWAFVWLKSDGQLQSEGVLASDELSQLPVADTTVVVLPWQALSWHSVRLPQGRLLRGQKLQTAVAALLEDEVLQDTAELHFAMAPSSKSAASSSKDSASTWVGVCDKAWLKTCLETLQAHVQRLTAVVPEFWPQMPVALNADAARAQEHAQAAANPLGLHLVADADRAFLIETGPQTAPSILGQWPLDESLSPSTEFSALRQILLTQSEQYAPSTVVTEPVCAALAERLVQAPLQNPIQLRSRSAAWRDKQLAQWGGWNWAQFDLQAFCTRHWGDRVQAALRSLWFAPHWRAWRLGVLALLCVHLLGWAAWTWAQANERKALKQQINAVLIQTFPQVKLVLDAPLQMQRELQRLRQQAGVLAADDFESLLQALAQQTGADAAPQNSRPNQLPLVSPFPSLARLDYAERQLRFALMAGAPQDRLNQLASTLGKGQPGQAISTSGHSSIQPLSLQADGDVWVFKRQALNMPSSASSPASPSTQADLQALWQSMQAWAEEARTLQAQLGQPGQRQNKDQERSLLSLWQKSLGSTSSVTLQNQGDQWVIKLQAVPASTWLQALQSCRSLGLLPSGVSLRAAPAKDAGQAAANKLAMVDVPLWSGSLSFKAP